MKFFYITLFFLIVSCSTTKKEYVCGDHPCIDKKEFNQYFSKNLIIEIKPQTNKKNKNINLVKLNTESSVEIKENKINSKKNDKIKAYEEKIRIKAEKKKLLQDRKIKEKDMKNKKKKETKKIKLSKVKMNFNKDPSNSIKDKINEKKIAINKTSSLKKNSLVNVAKKKNIIGTGKNKEKKSICAAVKDCNIDKITELLIKKGENKPFPNITVK